MQPLHYIKTLFLPRLKKYLSSNQAVCFAASIFVAGISLLIAQAILIHVSDEQLSGQSTKLLERAVSVARQSRETLVAIDALPTRLCSTADLAEMRYLLHGASHLQDVGRARNGRIICTAVWGVLSEPIALPPPEWKSGSNEALWKDARGFPDSRLKSDIGISNSAVTYTRRTVFEQYMPMKLGLQAALVSRDHLHIFQLFGANAERLVVVLGKPNNPFALRGRHQSICEKRFQICAVIRDNESASIWKQAPGLATLVLVLGALAGAGGGQGFLNAKRSKRTLQKQIQRALRRGEVRVAYQPIVALNGGSIVGVEALARWNDENGRPMSPDTFVPVIDDLGLGDVLTRTVTIRALAEAEQFLKQDCQLYISINVNASDIISKEFRGFLHRQVVKSGLERRQIALEITERQSTSMTDLADAVTMLRRCGYRVFIDDFGTGYSGIAYLANMQVDAVKIDRMFSSAIGTDSVHARMLEKICTMVCDVGGAIIVEGVETEAQAAMLSAAYPGATAQGWFFGKPFEGAAGFRALLAQ